jgi:hypothetical protein
MLNSTRSRHLVWLLALFALLPLAACGAEPDGGGDGASGLESGVAGDDGAAARSPDRRVTAETASRHQPVAAPASDGRYRRATTTRLTLWSRPSTSPVEPPPPVPAPALAEPEVELEPEPEPEVPSGPTCEAGPGGTCYYVAPDGSDAADGSFEAPLGTFRAALERVEPGDVIYARGGTYGNANAMAFGVERMRSAGGQGGCSAGETWAEGACYRDRRALIAIQRYRSWASRAGAYDVVSGTAERPLAVRAYPGEHAVLNVSGFSTTAVEINARAHWTIEGFEIVGGMLNIEGGTLEEQAHDITIRGNDIHDVVVVGDDNPGLVRIDRGDTGGPYNIFVHDNALHGISDPRTPGQWQDGAYDRQHFGAVTVLSREEYYGYDGGGTGYIEIVGNVMYDLPQVLFFKNPMAGPTEIRDNVIYDSHTLGNMTAANMRFHRNLVFDVRVGFERIGGRSYSDPRMLPLSGSNAVIEYNTFVGLDSLMSLRWGTGHRVERNVFFGMSSSVDGADYNMPAYISKHEVAPDPVALSGSSLQGVRSDHNCFFTPNARFQAVSRYLPPSATGSGWRYDHFDLEQARTLLGFDVSSRMYVEDDRAAVFVDPANGDYELVSPSRCPGMGWNAR